MLIFGWIVLVGLASAMSMASIIVLMGTVGLTGKIGGEFWFFFVVAALLVYAAITGAPFVLEMKS